MTQTPPPIVIEPSQPATSAMIFLHGLGADGNDLAGLTPHLPVEGLRTRMIFPNAPQRPVTINGGYVMPAWYDISDTALRNADQKSIAESTATVHALIDEQIAAGIASDKIIVAGFSQGGAIALHAGLRYERELAGIMALSCYVLERNDKHEREISEANYDTAIWMAHGLHDEVVPYPLGEASAEFLSGYGHAVTFVSYPMGHEISMPEVTGMSEWMTRALL
ncbi:MAG: carboxylesterase [Gammaproteobacteria bacterium]|nr:MAG: carboxylesterase [Gammaproteobacteria bacterium]